MAELKKLFGPTVKLRILQRSNNREQALAIERENVADHIII